MPLKTEKILVPVDFASASLDAVDYAAFVARQLNARITLLHVMEKYVYEIAADKKAVAEILRKGVEKKLAELQERKSLKGLDINIEIRTGKIYHEIDNLAEEGHYDVIIMGSHGGGGITDIKKFVLGSNAYRTVIAAPCPVITMKHKPDPLRIDHILLPLDITKDTRQKTSLALAIAKAFDAQIHVVSVSRFVDEFVVDISKLRRQVKEVAREIQEAGIKCTTRMIRHSNIAESVLDYSREINADMIMIMTKQERKWNEFIIGSSARTVITDADIPVLSVRPRKTED